MGLYHAPSTGFKVMEDPLVHLVEEAQQRAAQSEDHSSLLADCAEMLLRSRKLGRPPKGERLSGVYQEIYERVQQQLITDLAEALTTYHWDHPPVREWGLALMHQAFRAILDDGQLKRLALEAQQHPPKTARRQHALTQLVEAIRLSDKLIHPHRAKFSPSFYHLLHEEAVNQTLTYICRKIDTYDPERGKTQKFMTWVNFRLDKVLIECRREFSDQQVQALPDLNNLENLAHPSPPPTLADEVRDWIAADPDHLFRQAHIRDRPDANFQTLALARLAALSWEEISTQFAIKVPTLSSFFQRCCHKFAPQLKQYLQS